jgi:hypothetical protein
VIDGRCHNPEGWLDLPVPAVVDDDPQDRQPVLLHLDVHHLHKYIKNPPVCARKKVLQCGLTAMRQEAEVRRFSDYLVRFDHQEAGSRGEEV